MSIAELGLRIDSSDAKGAAVDLDALVAASQRAEKAQRDVGTASQQAQGGIRSLASAVASLTEAETRTGTGFAQKRAADIAAYGAELDRLRAKFNPIFAASKQYEAQLMELQQAQAVGAVGAQEYEAALEQLNAGYAMTADAAKAASIGMMQAGHAVSVANFQSKQLMYQLVDIGQTVPMAMMSPKMALIQLGYQIDQIGQIYYGRGGMKQALTDITAMLAGAGRAMLRFAANPVVLGIGAITAAVGGLAYAFSGTTKATNEAGKAVSESVMRFHSLDGEIGALESAAKAYAGAIASTADVQDQASQAIVASTRAEYEARKQVLQLKINDIALNNAQKRAAKQDAQDRIKALRDQIAAQEKYAAGQHALVEDELRRRNAGRSAASPAFAGLPSQTPVFPGAMQDLRSSFSDPAKEARQQLRSLQDEVTKLGDTTTLQSGSIRKAQEAIAKGWQGVDTATKKAGGATQTEADKAAEAIRSMAIEAGILSGAFGDMSPELVHVLDRLGMLNVTVKDGAVAAYKLADGWQAVAQAQKNLADQKALGDYLKNAKDWSNQLWNEFNRGADRAGQRGERAMRRFGQSIGDAVTQAKSLSDALSGVLQAIENIALNALSSKIGDAFSRLFGGGGGGGFLGGGGGFFGNLFNSIFGGGGGGGGGFSASDFGLSSFGLTGFDSGTSFIVGGETGVDNNVVAFRASRGEKVDVTPANLVGAPKSSAANVNVEIINNTGAPVSQERQQTPDGQRVRVIIGDMMATEAQRTGSSLNRVLKSMGAAAPLTRR